jgi:hypothetical protein
MDRIKSRWSASAALALMLTAVLAWSPSLPASTNSPTVTGNALAVQETNLGSGGTATTATVADTGTLSNVNDARDASQLTAGTPSVTAETPAAATISWSNEVDSTASVTNLNVAVGGVVITANSVFSAASSSQGPNSGITMIDGLAINGTPVSITGRKNQSVSIPGGQMTINETKSTGGTITVNALHIVMNGAADVVIASSTAGMS